MGSLNKVILVGNLGQDPDVKFLQSGSAVVNLSLATSESWKDKESGQQKEKTEWHKIVFFGRSAEVIGEFCSKGSSLCVEGSLQTRKWQDKDGNDRYTTEIVAHEMQMLDSKGQGNQGGGQRDDSYRAQQSSHQQAKADGFQPQRQDFDDDIPF